MRNMVKSLVRLAAICLLISACGGDSKTPTAPPTPVPTPVPTFSGTYSGTMLFNVAQQAEVTVTGRTTVTHSGNSLSFSDLSVSAPGFAASYPLGSGSVSGSSFTGGTTYQSSGCGRVSVATTGRFAGNLMNLTVVLIPEQCDRFELRGELSK